MKPLQIALPVRHHPIPVIRKIGAGVFVSALLVFLACFFAGSFQIHEGTLHQLAGKVPEDRLAKLRPLHGMLFSSRAEFLSRITALINDDAKVDGYNLGQYRFWITKSSTVGIVSEQSGWVFLLTIVLGIVGALLYILPQVRESKPGIKNNFVFFGSVTSRGALGMLTGIFLIGFYILLYWHPEWMTHWTLIVDPLSMAIKNAPADKWFLYGFLYTVAVIVMGIRMFVKYRHSAYQMIRTTSVIFFQFGFAFLIPGLLERMEKPAFDFKYAWPLNYYFFTDWNLNSLISHGALGYFMLFWGIGLIVLAVPLLTYFFGKRWYCSWVCGCGGLAETLGDPFRQLSDKSLKAWRFERWCIHLVLVATVVMTGMQVANYLSDGAWFGDSTWRVNQWYSFAIGSIFAGVIGTGFYPFMGSRVWCRFGCPLAAILGIIQKYKSKFRITTNGGQCMSCGNCSTYCEMGIDVRSYAMRGENIVRASCVGCGVCAAVCPRGVLSLENGPTDHRWKHAG